MSFMLSSSGRGAGAAPCLASYKRCDDEVARVTLVLVAVLELRVGLAHHAAVDLTVLVLVQLRQPLHCGKVSTTSPSTSFLRVSRTCTSVVTSVTVSGRCCLVRLVVGGAHHLLLDGDPVARRMAVSFRFWMSGIVRRNWSTLPLDVSSISQFFSFRSCDIL